MSDPLRAETLFKAAWMMGALQAGASDGPQLQRDRDAAWVVFQETMQRESAQSEASK